MTLPVSDPRSSQTQIHNPYNTYRQPNACCHVDLHRGRREHHRRMFAKPPTAVQDRRPQLLVAAPILQPRISRFIKSAFKQWKCWYYKLERKQEPTKGTCRFLRGRGGYRDSSVQHYYWGIGEVRLLAGV